MKNNDTQSNTQPQRQITDIKCEDLQDQKSANQPGSANHPIQDQRQLIPGDLRQQKEQEVEKSEQSASINNYQPAFDMDTSQLNEESNNLSDDQQANNTLQLVKQKTAVFGQQTVNDASENAQLTEKQLDSFLLKEENTNKNQDLGVLNENKPENMTQNKNNIINVQSSQSLSCDESLKCPEVIELLKSYQTKSEFNRNDYQNVHENESFNNIITQGAKNTEGISKHFQTSEQPIVKIREQKKQSSNDQKDNLKSLSPSIQNCKQKCCQGAGAVAVASPIPNYNGQTKLSSDAIAAKALLNHAKSPAKGQFMQQQQKKFNHYQKALSPHIANKAALDSHKQNKLYQNQFDSPDHNSKILYNVNSHSGNKINDITNSPFPNEKFKNLIKLESFSNKKNKCRPMNDDCQYKPLISAPGDIIRKQKEQFCSPNHNENEINQDANVSDNDARFSSNTTERYRTRCSKGSVIHSNFKINQNSLQKQHTFKNSKQLIQYSNQNSERTMSKQISFAPIQEMVTLPQKPEIQNSNVSTPNMNLSFQKKLKYEDNENYSAKKQNQNQSLFNYENQNLMNIGNFAQNLQTSKFGYHQNAFSPALIGRDSNNSPDFANPLLNQNLHKNLKSSPSKSSAKEILANEQFQIQTPLFQKKQTQNSVFKHQKYQPYPPMFRVGGQEISANRVKEHQFSSQKLQTSESSSDSEQSQGSSGNSSSNSSSMNRINLFNMSQQSQTYKYDHGLFAQMDPQNPSFGLSSSDQMIYNKCQAIPGFNHWHPFLKQALLMQQINQEHQQNLQQFNFLNPKELLHHPFHNTLHNHVPGCTLKCSCGLLNMTADQFFFPRDKMNAARSRADSDISMKSPTKHYCQFAQYSQTMQNFYQTGIPPFQHLGSSLNPFNQFMPPIPDLSNLGGMKQKKESHKKGKHLGKRRAPEDDNDIEKTDFKKQKTSQESEAQNNEVLKTPDNRQLKGYNSTRGSNLIQLHDNQDDESADWSSKQRIDENDNQMLITMNSKSKKSKISRTQTKRDKDQFDAPDAILPSRDFNDDETPQKHSDFILMNNKCKKRSQANTQLKTMDTMNRNSNIKGNQFDLEISPASKFDPKFNSSMKENIEYKLIDQELKQIHFTNEKKMRSDHAESAGINCYSNKRGQRINQMSVSKISLQEKEQINQKNEELIKQMTDKIISETLTQEQLFKKIKAQEPRVQQCMGCKCKNTKCLKLYCECLRNKATCGPTCQCKQFPKSDNDVCNNNDDFKEERRNAIRDILKRNILAFEDKVKKDEHFKGCKCKNSFCQKKYCECFERGVPCTNKCKCKNCRNTGVPCGTHNNSSVNNQLTAQNENESMFVREHFLNTQLNNKSEDIVYSEINNQGLSTNIPEQQNKFHQRQFNLDQESYYNGSNLNENEVKLNNEQQALMKTAGFEISMEQVPSYISEQPEKVQPLKQGNKSIIDFSIQPQEQTNQSNEKFEVEIEEKPNLRIQLGEEKKQVNYPSVPQKLSFNVSSHQIENAFDAREKNSSSVNQEEQEQSQSQPKKDGNQTPLNGNTSLSRASKRITKQPSKKDLMTIVKKSSTTSQKEIQLKTKTTPGKLSLNLDKLGKPDRIIPKSGRESTGKKQIIASQLKKQNSLSNQQSIEKMVTRQSNRIKNRQQKQNATNQEVDENNNPNSRQAL